MKCWGRTRTLKRCSREVQYLFCHDHARPAAWIFLTFLIGAIWWFYQDEAKRFITNVMVGPPKHLEVEINSTALDLLGKNEPAISLNEISNRRLHLLEIRNPNSRAISNLSISTQFPEAILSVSAGEKPASYKVDSAENWDKQGMTITGDTSQNMTVEPLASDEKTGLWTILIDRVDPRSTAKIQLITTSGGEGQFYNQGVKKARERNKTNETIWILDTRYQFISDSVVLNERRIVPLEFDEQSRIVRVSGPTRPPDEVVQVQIQQGRGVRVPGVLTSKGYIVIRGKNSTVYESPIMLERQDIDAMFGLFGPLPGKPGLRVQLKRENFGLEQR